jgi:biotin transport system substrate-specific component
MPSAISSRSALADKPILESVPGRIVLAVSATALVAACAHVSVPLPFTPVPLTLQNFAVLLVGMVLGPVAGFSTMVLYLTEGATGLPVFNPSGLGGVAQLLGPTAGFLFSYPLAAAAAGLVARSMRQTRTAFTRGLVAGVAASAIIFVFGAGWLATLLHLSAPAAWRLAVAPFMVGEVIKVTAAAIAFSTIQRWRQS